MISPKEAREATISIRDYKLRQIRKLKIKEETIEQLNHCINLSTSIGSYRSCIDFKNYTEEEKAYANLVCNYLLNQGYGVFSRENNHGPGSMKTIHFTWKEMGWFEKFLSVYRWR